MSEKLKIAFLLGNINATGGIARATSIIADELSKTYDIYIINYSRGNKTEISREQPYGHYFTLNSKNISMSRSFFSCFFKLKKYIKSNNIDILVTCGALYFTLGALSTKFTKTKVIAWEHSNFHSNMGHKMKKYNRKIGAKLSDFIIVLTKHDKDTYIKKMGVKNIDFIYNPIPDELINKSNDLIESTKIITVGNLNKFKNYEGLIKVAAKLFPLCPEWKWDIYGDGQERSYIEALINEYNLNNNLFIKGRCNNIYDKYNEYAFYVCTSRSEGLPMSLLEAKACYLPIISYDILTGPNEIINDKKNGFLVEFENVDEMVKKIIELIEDKDLRITMSNNTRIDIEKFSMGECIKKWHHVIKEVINN